MYRRIIEDLVYGFTHLFELRVHFHIWERTVEETVKMYFEDWVEWQIIFKPAVSEVVAHM